MNEKYGKEFIALEEYKGKGKKILVRHNFCGFERYVTPNHLLRRGGCPVCSGKMFKSTEKFKKDLFNLVGNEFSLLEEYKGTMHRVLFTHNTCGHSYLSTPNNILLGRGCPICRESLGERKIRKILSDIGIKFKSQIRLNGCVLQKKLPFDFGILNPDESLKFLVEYDGILHYPKNIKSEGAKEFFKKSIEKTALTDSIKNEFCSKHGIRLLRIPYTEYDNIAQILSRELFQVGQVTSKNGVRII